MNILFIEDDLELSKNAVIQLEEHGHVVTPVFDLAAAREALEVPGAGNQLVVTDHQLPDGLGISFAVEMKSVHPHAVFIVVSGFLTSRDIHTLEQADIPYYHKPLLYGKIIDEYRRLRALRAPVAAPVEVVAEDPDPEPVVEEPIEETPQPKKKKWFGLFGGDGI